MTDMMGSAQGSEERLETGTPAGAAAGTTARRVREAGILSRILRVRVCEGFPRRTGGTAGLALSYAQAPTVDALMTLFRALAADDQGKEGGHEQRAGQTAKQQLVVWAPPLAEVLAHNATWATAPDLDVHPLIQRLQAELADAVRPLLRSRRMVLISVEPFDIAGLAEVRSDVTGSLVCLPQLRYWE